MTYGPITSWQTKEGKVEARTNFIFLGSKITEDDNCSHEIKILAPWKESCDKSRWCFNKQRHHFANKGPSSQAMVFPVVMYECEYWNIKKAER